MNSLALRGLFRDALLQVLDNRVFRVLLVLALVPILATVLIGLKDESISFFFGFWTLDYPEFLYQLGDEPRVYLVELFRAIFVEGMLGSVGITICVAATAFYVPLMLEKGSADLIFTKPISRTTLFLSRYVTGLIFVGALATFLNVGIYFGLGIRSGVWSPGILWSTLTLVYLFALVHAVTMLIGLVTKSTPAAMILGIMFFMFNGCVHGTWQTVEAYGAPLDQMTQSAPTETEEEALEAEKFETLKSVGRKTLNTVHYVLPKTTEAPELIVHVQAALGFDRTLETRTGFREAEGNRAAEQDSQFSDPEAVFARRFGFDAEDWRYNAWFSLLSSLAFVGVVLGAGCWRIRRLDL